MQLLTKRRCSKPQEYRNCGQQLETANINFSALDFREDLETIKQR